MEPKRTLSISQFCEKYGMSRTSFWRYQQNGTGPLVTKIGGMRVVLTDTAEAWLRDLEARSADQQRIASLVGERIGSR